MNKPTLFLLALLVTPFAGCSDDDDDKTVTTTGTTTGTPTATTPAAPSLGQQIERMGRAGITTATQGAFEGDSAKKNAIKDTYNADSTRTGWKANFATGIASALAIYDSLDTVCGNQFAAGPAGAGRYDALAGVIADDQVYVNTATGTCSVYLAVEANATGIIPNSDCGGRTPLMDVIDVTYSVVAIGAVSGVTDGIPVDADGTHSNTSFPFLANPN